MEEEMKKRYVWIFSVLWTLGWLGIFTSIGIISSEVRSPIGEPFWGNIVLILLTMLIAIVSFGMIGYFIKEVEEAKK